MTLFNICFICTLTQTGVIKDALTPCYDHVEVAYWHNKKIKVVGKDLKYITIILILKHVHTFLLYIHTEKIIFFSVCIYNRKVCYYHFLSDLQNHLEWLIQSVEL